MHAFFLPSSLSFSFLVGTYPSSGRSPYDLVQVGLGFCPPVQGAVLPRKGFH